LVPQLIGLNPGTEEEFNRAYSRLKARSDGIEILFYFKDAGIPPSRTDADQLKKVQEFRAKLGSEYGAFYHQFEAPDDFGNKVRIHLSMLLQDFLRNNSISAIGRSLGALPDSESRVISSLSNFTALTEDDYEEGFIELEEQTVNAMNAVSAAMQKVIQASSDLTIKVRTRTQEFDQIRSAGSIPDQSALKQAANRTADDLEDYVQELSCNIPEINAQYALAMDCLGKAATISNADFKQGPENIRKIIATLETARKEITVAKVMQAEFRDTLFHLPRMTSNFNRARRRAVAILDDFISQFQTLENQTYDLEQLLGKLVASSKP
jgi:hypothetical protein